MQAIWFAHSGGAAAQAGRASLSEPARAEEQITAIRVDVDRLLRS